MVFNNPRYLLFFFLVFFIRPVCSCDFPIPNIQSIHDEDGIKKVLQCYFESPELLKDIVGKCPLVNPKDHLYNPRCIKDIQNDLVIKYKKQGQIEDFEKTKLSALLETYMHYMVCSKDYQGSVAQSLSKFKKKARCEIGIKDRLSGLALQLNRLYAKKHDLKSSSMASNTSCPNINLLAKNSKSPFLKMHKNRQFTGICSAHAVSQYLDYINAISDNTDETISPLWIAYIIANDKNVNDIGAQFATNSIESIEKHGNCPKRLMYKGMRELLKKTGAQDDVIYVERIIEQNLSFINKDNEDGQCSVAPRHLFQVKNPESSCSNDRHISTVVDFMENIRKIASNPNSTASILKVVFKYCEDKKNRIFPKKKYKIQAKKVLNPETREIDLNSIKSAYEFINTTLSLGKPALINYCSAIHYYSDYKYNSKNTDKCRAHEVVIAGSRYHQNKCQYLIRSSWKTRDINSSGDGVFNHYINDKGEVEGYWIDYEILKKNTKNIDYSDL